MLDMHPKIKRAITDLLSQIGRVHKTEEDVILTEKLLADIPDIYIWIDYEVNVAWSVKSFDEVKKVLATFAKAGVMLDEYFKSDTNPRWRLKGRNVGISLSPRWEHEGTVEEGVTCKLVRVGTKTVEQPIFKLVCNSVDGETI